MKNDVARRRWLILLTIILSAVMAPWLVLAQTASPELIVDICTAPHKYWNKYVMLKGHVRSVAANPPGTNRGSYVLRDSSDADITVLTTELPAMGKEYAVSGNVEQTSPDSKVPVIREFKRTSGSESTPQAAPVRRAAPPEESAPVRRREPAAPSAPAPQPAAPQVREVQPVVIQTTPESSGMSTMLIVAVAAVAVLAILVVVVMMRPKPAPPAPAAYAPPIPTAAPAPIRPPAPPPPTSSRTASPPSPARTAATQVVPPPAPKATEVFMDLGADLAVTDGPDKGKRFNLTKPTLTIGRSGARQNDITLSDSTVSREHARILYASAEKSFRLINESATNPVRLNGNPIDTVLIKDGDTIQLGATIMKFSKRA